MGELSNFISPELLASKGMTERDFTAACIKAGLSQDTARRLMSGDTNFSTNTLKIVAKILGVRSIGNVVDINGGH